MKYLDPRADLTFKKVFGEHPDLMISFLNAMLPLKDDVRAWVSCVEYANGRRIRSMSPLWKILCLRSRIDRLRKNFHHCIKRGTCF